MASAPGQRAFGFGQVSAPAQRAGTDSIPPGNATSSASAPKKGVPTFGSTIETNGIDNVPQGQPKPAQGGSHQAPPPGDSGQTPPQDGSASASKEGVPTFGSATGANSVGNVPQGQLNPAQGGSHQAPPPEGSGQAPPRDGSRPPQELDVRMKDTEEDEMSTEEEYDKGNDAAKREIQLHYLKKLSDPCTQAPDEILDLGISDTTPEEQKTRYQFLLKLVHPNKAVNLSEEQSKQATEAAQKLIGVLKRPELTALQAIISPTEQSDAKDAPTGTIPPRIAAFLRSPTCLRNVYEFMAAPNDAVREQNIAGLNQTIDDACNKDSVANPHDLGKLDIPEFKYQYIRAHQILREWAECKEEHPEWKGDAQKPLQEVYTKTRELCTKLQLPVNFAWPSSDLERPPGPVLKAEKEQLGMEMDVLAYDELPPPDLSTATPGSSALAVLRLERLALGTIVDANIMNTVQPGFTMANEKIEAWTTVGRGYFLIVLEKSGQSYKGVSGKDAGGWLVTSTLKENVPRISTPPGSSGLRSDQHEDNAKRFAGICSVVQRKSNDWTTPVTYCLAKFWTGDGNGNTSIQFWLSKSALGNMIKNHNQVESVLNHTWNIEKGQSQEVGQFMKQMARQQQGLVPYQRAAQQQPPQTQRPPQVLQPQSPFAGGQAPGATPQPPTSQGQSQAEPLVPTSTSSLPAAPVQAQTPPPWATPYANPIMTMMAPAMGGQPSQPMPVFPPNGQGPANGHPQGFPQAYPPYQQVPPWVHQLMAAIQTLSVR